MIITIIMVLNYSTLLPSRTLLLVNFKNEK